MAQRTGETEFTLDTAAELADETIASEIRGRSPWYLAWRRLRRNYVAFFFLFVFVAVVLACALAPVYASHVAHSGPNSNHILEVVNVNGHPEQVVSLGGVIKGKLVASLPIGPTWFGGGGKFVLGADGSERSRRGGAAALRGPQLAARRDRLVGDLRVLRRRARPARGLLPAAGSTS